MWVLCTCEQPLTLWFYLDGYLRFTARPFALDTLEDPIAHVTNVEFQRESDEGRAAIAAGGGALQWHTDELLAHLARRGEAHHWHEELLPQMQEIVIAVFRAGVCVCVCLCVCGRVCVHIWVTHERKTSCTSRSLVCPSLRAHKRLLEP